MDNESDRSARFVKDLEELKLKVPSSSRPVIMVRLSMVVMVTSVVIGVVAYFLSHGTTNPLTQRDAIVLGLLAVTLAVVGAVVYLRYSLTNYLRFWLARQSFDQQMQAEYIAESVSAAINRASDRTEVQG